jgi:hypothetical protein
MWSTAASWVALLALTAALTKYYNPGLFDKLTGHAFVRSRSHEAIQPTGGKRQKTKRTHTSQLNASTSGASTPTSATEGKANKRRKIISAPVENTVVAETAERQQVELPRVEHDGMNNQEFAQQLAKAQAGTKLEPSKAHPTGKKERRVARKASQSTQNGREASGISTETSSTTGRDADDDLSPIGSPSTGPVSTAPTSRAGDVSDMLEAPAPKPTTLRLTDIKEAAPKNGTKASSKAFEPVLTKKQRQRQAKQAEQKALREEADRLHEAKKQAQLRSARMAEGSSNQTKANSFTSKPNAWQAATPSSEKLAPTTLQTEAAPLLDTFEKKEPPAVHINGAVQSEPLSQVTKAVPETANVNQVRQEEGESKTNALAASDREKLGRPVLETRPSWADEVNEEEQTNWANDLAQEEKWEPVTTKKGKKKVKKDDDTSSQASSSFARSTTTVNSKPLANGSGKLESGSKPRPEHANRFQSIEPVTESSFQDAEWEA